MAWNSSIKIGNWPLLSVGFVARGIIAIGFTGYGFITIAQFGIGVIAICQFSIGIITVSQFSFAFVTLGQICAGIIVAIGQISAGFFAFGISNQAGYYTHNLNKIESAYAIVSIMQDTIIAHPFPFYVWSGSWAFILLIIFHLVKNHYIRKINKL